METKEWLEDFMTRLQNIDDYMVASLLVKSVQEYWRMTSISPEIDDWFMEYSPKNTEALLNLATTLEVRIRSHQANGEMMLTPHLMILAFTCRGITDQSLTADVVNLWVELKSRGRNKLRSVGWLMDEEISEALILGAEGFEPSALFQKYNRSLGKERSVSPSFNPIEVEKLKFYQKFERGRGSVKTSMVGSKLLLLPIVFCVFGVLPLPYDYYLLLRAVVCASAALVVYYDLKNGNESWIIFAIVGALFNPFVPVYLNKPIWIVIDLATAGLFYRRYQRG